MLPYVTLNRVRNVGHGTYPRIGLEKSKNGGLVLFWTRVQGNI